MNLQKPQINNYSLDYRISKCETTDGIIIELLKELVKKNDQLIEAISNANRKPR